MKRESLMRWPIGLLAAVMISGAGAEAWAQTRASRGSSALGGFGTVGRTGVALGSQLGREGGLPAGAPQRSSAATGNFVPMSSGLRGPIAPPSARTLNNLRRPVPGGVNDAFINPLTFGLARRFATMGRDYTGRNSWARVGTFGGGIPLEQPYIGLQAPQALLYENAFLAPVREANLGGRIRDQLTNLNLKNLPSDYETLTDPSIPRRSYSDMLEARLVAQDHQNLKDAWELFARGEYCQASSRFRLAWSPLRRDMEPMLGMFFCGLATGQFESAMACVDRMIPAATEGNVLSPDEGQEQPNPFACQVDLRALTKLSAASASESGSTASGQQAERKPRPWSETQLKGILAWLDMAAQSTKKQSDHPAAAYALVRWYAGERDSALQLAEQIREKDRMSRYARMASQMREALAAETAAGEGDRVSVSTP
jgi:hypothetical protein